MNRLDRRTDAPYDAPTMKHLIQRIVISGTLVLGLAVSALGQATVALPDPPSGATRGRVLVLLNEGTRTGDIERIGDQYRIRHVIGETWLPADKVLKLCGSLDEAYQLLRSRANLNDPDERLRLSEWCRQHDLRTQALNEIREATYLRPNDPRFQRMLNHLQTTSALPKPKPALSNEPPAPRVEVSSDAASQFAVRVQPILMNACVRCHNSGRGGQFQLTRVSATGMSDRRAMEKNLAAVLAEVNAREPQLSRLLTKSVSIHGRDMGQAPLTGRDTVAFRTMEHWVFRTIANNPHLLDRVVASVSTKKSNAAMPASTPPETGEKRWGSDREPVRQPRPTAAPTPAIPAAPTPGPVPVPTTARPPSVPMSTPGSPDPVDPDAFNREFHPAPKEPAGTRQDQGNGR